MVEEKNRVDQTHQDLKEAVRKAVEKVSEIDRFSPKDEAEMKAVGLK